MSTFARKLRSHALALAGLVASRIKLTLDLFQGKSPDLPNCTLLEPGLFIGGACSKPPPNTRAVLNLSPNPDEYSVEEYRWQPLHSGSCPTIPWLRVQVEFVDSCRRAGKSLFVHCDAGIDRSALVVIAYFMWRQHLTREQAFDLVQRKRAVVHPNYVFTELLDRWERALDSAGGTPCSTPTDPPA